MKSSENINKKKRLIEWIFTIILFVYPMRKAFVGLDLMDAGYSLGNYKYFDTMHEGWKLATYLANVTGMVLSKLPFGNTWVGMNLYTSAFIGITAAFVYRFFVVRTTGKMKNNHVILFIAEIFGLSLCWSPSVILYQNLGYIFMSFAVIILYKAIKEEKNTLYITAGIVLGLAVMVRMPNITYMAFIIPLWYNCIVNDLNWKNNCADSTDNSNNKYMILIKKTLFCITGYLLGAIIPLICICIKYGFSAYPNMISWLFGMTENAADYKSSSMIMSMFNDYFCYGIWFLLFVVYAILGIIAAKFLQKCVNSKNPLWDLLYKVLFAAGFAILLRLCYGRGMFDFDYSEYFCMYKWVTVYLIIVIIMCIIFLLRGKTDADIKLWSVFLPVIIFITPLGSNNGLYPIINNLYIVAPCSAYMLYLLFEEIAHSKFVADKKAYFALKFVLCAVIFCTVLQSVLFGVFFVFHDAESMKDKKYQVQTNEFTALRYLNTAILKKNAVEELGKFISQNDLKASEVILFGDIPAVSYLFDLKPAIYTTWVDLDSNSLELLKNNLTELENRDEDYPIVILGNDAVAYLDTMYMEKGMDTYKYRKLILIREFMEKNEYVKSFSNDVFSVFIK